MGERLAAVPGDRGRIELLQAMLLSRLPADRDGERRAEAILQALVRLPLGGEGRIARVAAELGLAERSLRRHCEALLGLGPKTLDRILRFQRVLRRLRSGRTSLAALAAECGYADQAHLSRETRRLSGLTPADLVRQLAVAGPLECAA
jgi:AraC-like DNA-binding protein